MLKIEKHIWQPDFPNEITITDQSNREEFEITLKQNSENIEISFDWNYGYGGNGSKTTNIPIKLLLELLEELKTTNNEKKHIDLF